MRASSNAQARNFSHVRSIRSHETCAERVGNNSATRELICMRQRIASLRASSFKSTGSFAAARALNQTFSLARKIASRIRGTFIESFRECRLGDQRFPVNRLVAIVNSLQLKYLRRRRAQAAGLLLPALADVCPKLPRRQPYAGLKLKLLTDVSPSWARNSFLKGDENTRRK